MVREMGVCFVVWYPILLMRSGKNSVLVMWSGGWEMFEEKGERGVDWVSLAIRP